MSVVETESPIDTKAVASMLGIKTRTVTRLAERGEIVGFKVGTYGVFIGETSKDTLTGRSASSNHRVKTRQITRSDSRAGFFLPSIGNNVFLTLAQSTDI